MDSAKSPQGQAEGPPRHFRHSRRTGLIRLLLINLCVLLVPVGVYYVLVVMHYEQYRHERSFRALSEMASYIDAKLETAVGLFRNAPRPVVATNATDADQQKREEDRRREEAALKLLRRLVEALPNIRYGKLVEKEIRAKACLRLACNVSLDAPAADLREALDRRSQAAAACRVAGTPESAAAAGAWCPDERQYDLIELMRDFNLYWYATQTTAEAECKNGCTVDEVIKTLEKSEKPGTGKLDSPEEIERFRQMIADLRWNVDIAEETPDARRCPEAYGKVLPLLDTAASTPLVRFVDCARDRASLVAIDAPISTMLSSSVVGEEFERVVIATVRGEIVADHAAGEFGASSGTLKPKGDGAPIGMLDLLSLLDAVKSAEDKRLIDRLATGKTGVSQPASAVAAATKAYVLLDSPQQVSVQIGANVHAAYVLPFRPSTAIYRPCADGICLYGTQPGSKRSSLCSSSPNSPCIEQEPAFYVIGLSRPTAREAARDSMQPFGLLILLVILGMAVALWPLIRLRFLEPHDSICWTFARTATIGVVVAVVILSAAGEAIVLRQRLSNAARGAAASLADAMATSFRRELERQVRFVEAFELIDATSEACYDSGRFREENSPAQTTSVYRFSTVFPTWTRDFTLLMRVDDKGGVGVLPEIPLSPLQSSTPWVPDLIHRAGIETNFRVERAPLKVFERAVTADLPAITTAMPNMLVNAKCRTSRVNSVRVSSRAYFTGAKTAPSCIPTREGDAACDLKFAVARVFNFRDGVKLLSLAVRRERQGAFDGITLGDTRFVAWSNAVLPYHFQFAIFDNATGATIFHSNESRALTENFLSETERPPALLAAIGQRTNQDFDGAYRGVATRFSARPLYTEPSMRETVPWTLVVFYEDAPLDSIPLFAYLTTIIAVLPILLLGIAAGSLAVRACGGTMLWLWPQWRLRNAYVVAAFTVVLLGVFAAIAMTAVPDASMALVIALLPIAAIALMAALLEPASAHLDFGYVLGKPLPDRELAYSGRRVLVAVYLSAAFGIALVVAMSAASARATSLMIAALALHFAAALRVFQCRPKLDAETGHGKAVVPRRQSGWWEDITLDPQPIQLDPSLERWSMRHSAFAVALLLVIATMPVCVAFKIGATEQLRAATLSALDRTADRLDRRIKRIRDDGDTGRARHEPALQAALDYGMHVPRIDGRNLPVPTLGLCPKEPPLTCAETPPGKPAYSWTETARRLIGITPANAWMLRSDDDAGRDDGAGFIQQVRHFDADRYYVRYPEATGAYLRQLADTGRTAGSKYATDAVAVLATLALLALLAAMLRYLGRHLFGPPLSWTGQFGPQPLRRNLDEPAQEGARFVLAIRSNGAAAHDAAKVAAANTIDLASLSPSRVERLLRAASGPLLLKRLDVALLDPERRVRLLPILEDLLARTTAEAPVYFAVDVPPLYRLCRPGAYHDDEPKLQPSEQLRWINLFSCMEKRYGAFSGGTVGEPQSPAIRARYRRAVEELIDQEARPMWPALRTIARQLEDQLLRHNDNLQCTERDVVEYFALRGEVHFRAAWEMCTRDERLALYQLARNRLVNVENTRTLEHLKRRGLIVLEPYARITALSFKEFVLHAELPGTFEQWEAEASEGLWQSIRLPLMIVLLLILAWVAYSSGETLNVMVALVGSALTFLGTLFRTINFVRSGQDVPTPPKR